jgi:hypothetical protein
MPGKKTFVVSSLVGLASAGVVARKIVKKNLEKADIKRRNYRNQGFAYYEALVYCPALQDLKDAFSEGRDKFVKQRIRTKEIFLILVYWGLARDREFQRRLDEINTRFNESNEVFRIWIDWEKQEMSIYETGY